MERANLSANAASFAIVKICLQPFSVFYLYSEFRAVKGAKKAMLAFAFIPSWFAKAPGAGFIF